VLMPESRWGIDGLQNRTEQRSKNPDRGEKRKGTFRSAVPKRGDRPITFLGKAPASRSPSKSGGEKVATQKGGVPVNNSQLRRGEKKTRRESSEGSNPKIGFQHLARQLRATSKKIARKKKIVLEKSRRSSLKQDPLKEAGRATVPNPPEEAKLRPPRPYSSGGRKEKSPC